MAPPSLPARSRLRRALARLPFVPFVLAASIALSGTVDAQQSSILHEFLPPDPQENLSWSTTTIDGDLPAAVQTPSGIATAPDPRRPPDARNLYGGSTTDDTPESTYEPDRDTRRPNVENYEDPFTPSTAPFKRLRAFDAVLDDYTLAVRDKTLRPVPIGGTLAPGEETFYGDFSVGLVPDQPVRIPNVGPGSRLLRLSSNPETRIEVLRDGADNWFVRGHDRKEVRLVVQLGIPRAAFGSAFTDVGWTELDRLVPPQPTTHRAAFAQVADAIGISRAMRPRDVLEKMVGYFRSFEPSDDPPRGREDIYLDLALTRKGVCRHRSFAFLVTALNIGLPARMVVNEAHAWVEAFDGNLWHRIDLGGAALNMESQQDDRPAHQPPPDPYAWPESQDSGQEMADRARNDAGGQSGNAQNGGTNGATPSPSATTSSSAAPPEPAPAPSATEPADPNAPPAEITVGEVGRDVRRGLPVILRGEVKSGGSACPNVRVDVVLRSTNAPEGIVVGSLSTDERGAYNGPVVIPRELSLGEYELGLRTPGGARCGAGGTK
ncbi:transglutaminase domain-containing protein [Polyangium sorediatum]|uniref:transglutaminase domain-containing protein n=1 Tax=Polyangium sorediatum TaxID=889274 RepID=UPI002548516F|nr:transglutaminase domain-containing protein [Polyangium sorediatum]